MTDKEKIKELNKHKNLIKKGDLVASKKYDIGIVVEVLYDEDVWNPIGVDFEGKIKWLDAKGGGSDTEEGDAKYYKNILL